MELSSQLIQFSLISVICVYDPEYLFFLVLISMSSTLFSLPHFLFLVPSCALILCTLKPFSQGKVSVLYIHSLYTWKPLLPFRTLPGLWLFDASTPLEWLVFLLPRANSKGTTLYVKKKKNSFTCVSCQVAIYLLLIISLYYILIEDFGTRFTVLPTQIVPSSLTTWARVGCTAAYKIFHFPNLLNSATHLHNCTVLLADITPFLK